MRVRLSLATGLIASLALLGACQQEPETQAWQDEAPPPAMETVEVAPLAGGPTASSQVAAQQAADDAWLARLEAKGLIAKRQLDPDTGKMVWVISNRPVPNPVLFGGPSRSRHAGLAPRRSRGAIATGVYADSSSSARPAAASSSASAAASSAAPAATATPAAPTTDSAAAAADAAAAAPVTTATGPGVQPIPEADRPANIVDPARAGFEMTPMMWGIVGLIVLALLAALFFANRPKPRRQAYHATQAPPEASGGSHEPHHA